MRALGVHQGLAPVLDVARDLRWGRVEETIGEDPWLVGTIGAAYVRGLESAGVVSTLKHFAGYSASRGGRNLAPVSIGPRELADVLLPPFEQALRAGARSVMNAYPDLDGLPVAADPALLTELLRGAYGFAGTVVADYFAVTFLHSLHGVAADAGEAAGLALAAGIDVELPTVAAYGEPLVAAVESGAVDEGLVDRALARVLAQKCELGLLDAGWAPEPPGAVDLDPPEARELAGELARRSIVLLANDGTLPLAPGRRVAVVGPRAHDPHALLGCYAFPVHVGVHHPDVPDGVALPTVLDALRADHDVVFAPGGDVTEASDADIAEAARAAAGADVCVAVLGDRSGLFGRGTSGEGCDAADLRLPGRQEELLEALLATGTPWCSCCWSAARTSCRGRSTAWPPPCARSSRARPARRALADVLAGRVNPGGRLPVHFPAARRGPAGHLPARRGAAASTTAAVRVRPRPVLRPGRVGRRVRGGGAWPTDGAIAGRGHAAQRRGPRHLRGRPGLPPRPGRRGGPAGPAADRRRPRRPRAGRGARRPR